MKKKTVIVISTIVLVLLIDQLVKIWVKSDVLSSVFSGGNFQIRESKPLIPNVIQLYFIENRGMAFGTTLGDGIWAKYVLSIFRLGAIVGIAIYLQRLVVENVVNMTFLITIALIFAGATGNSIDGMFYDYTFGIDPSIDENWMLNDFNMPIYDDTGNIVLRKGGFLLGSVVDMFQFTLKWPEWFPFGYNGKEIFPFIFNVADASISLGVVMIALKYRKFFKKEKDASEKEEGIVIS